jgi:transaldolase/glucose-6-phosphate isomerase
VNILEEVLLLPRQEIYPGKLAPAWRRELDNLVSGDAVNRLWAKDATLWRLAEGRKRLVGGNLAWLDLPERVGAYMAKVREFAEATIRDGFQDVVFIAMGDSNLAAETLLNTSAEMRYRRLFLLDSTDPGAIRAVDEQLDYQTTLFVVANKSGKRIETHALLLYFLNRLRAQGVKNPGGCFIAVTEEDSYLSEMARTYEFLGIFHDPPGIKGRYSSLIHFGLLLSAIWNSEPQVLVSRAMAMRDACRQSATVDKNPAPGLAAFLAAAAVEENDKLLLVGTRSLQGLTYRIGQLVGASTCKEGQGLLPICNEPPRWLEIYRRGFSAAILKMREDEKSEINEFEMLLRKAGVPTVAIEMDNPEESGAEAFKWEIATALACVRLEVNPFDEPDVLGTRERISQTLEALSAKQQRTLRTARVREKGIELYAEGETRQQISTLNLSEALRTFLEGREADAYLAIITYAGSQPATDAALRRLREQLVSRVQIPILLSSGPRYLRNFEQVYKGGPSRGLFLILTTEPQVDLDIPGAGYTFGQLQLALALSDFEALGARRMLVMQLHFTLGLEQGLLEFEHLAHKL